MSDAQFLQDELRRWVSAKERAERQIKHTEKELRKLGVDPASVSTKEEEAVTSDT